MPPGLPVPLERLEPTSVRPPILSSTDGALRWKEGERLHHLLEQACLRFAGNDAVATNDAVITYREVDRRANQVARYLIEEGIEPGDRVGLLLDKSVETYVALLAVMKVGAAWLVRHHHPSKTRKNSLECDFYTDLVWRAHSQEGFDDCPIVSTTTG